MRRRRVPITRSRRPTTSHSRRRSTPRRSCASAGRPSALRAGGSGASGLPSCWNFLASLALALLAVVALVVIIVIATNGGSGKPTPPPPSTGPSLSAAITGKGYLAAGSSSSALPGNILVADENNHRLLLLSPEGQLGWSYPRLNGPSDAYPSATNRSIAVTEHSNFQVLVLGVSRRSIDYHYGHSGVPGSGVDRLHDPGTAQRLANGQLVIADKSNCRILFVVPPSHHPVLTLGRPHACRHDPPTRFSYPDAVFPTSDGGLVVTEFTPAWIDVLSAHHTLLDEIRVSGLSAPYDANQVSGDEYIATNHAHPGAVEEFNTAGKVLWSYDVASGPGELYDPTLAEALPDGNVLVSDSRNDRVIVIDRATKKIIWQYGHTGKGTGAYGFLHTPDSAVLIR